MSKPPPEEPVPQRQLVVKKPTISGGGLSFGPVPRRLLAAKKTAVPSGSALAFGEAQSDDEASSNDIADQSGARAGGDVVGHDKISIGAINVVNASPEGRGGIIEQLLNKLRHEIENDERAKECVENLQYFYNRRSHDGVEGLEAKLATSGQEDRIQWALEQKERFVKLLERWSLYASAQEIFAYLLAKADFEFSVFVAPQLGTLTTAEINELLSSKVVDPTVSECGTEIFSMNHGVAMGMVFWLAEQCFVRWHR